MNFSPSFAIPEQMQATTPNMFITDQYGKEAGKNGDGPLTINEAIRISKLINKYVPAFTKVDNRIIDGFEVESVRIENGQLKIVVAPGLGVVGRTVFRLPMRTELVWKDFPLSVPAAVSSGNVLLFFEYSDLIQNFPNRPLPQSDPSFEEEPHYPTTKLPKDQSLFSPIRVGGNLYDPAAKELIDPEKWDESSDKILIFGGIYFRRNSSGAIEVSYDGNDRSPVLINGKEYVPQTCGYAGSITVDGGVISDEPYVPVEKLPYIIDVYYNKSVFDPAAELRLSSVPSTFDEFYLFLNGVLLHPETDFTVSENAVLSFIGHQLHRGDYIYAFENVSGIPSGFLKSLYRAKIEETTKRVDIETMEPDQNLFVFYDGILIDPVQYEIHSGYIKFVVSLEAGKHIDILEAVESPLSCLEILYNDEPNIVSPHNAFIWGINPSKPYLVFYGGKLAAENADYTLRKNIISFSNELVPTSNEKLIVMRV